MVLAVQLSQRWGVKAVDAWACMHNKKNEVEIIAHETLGGGFSPPAVNAIFRYKRMARAGFDNTKYRKSTKHISYLAHHTQSISTAITREDSRAMHEALSKKMAELSRHRPGGRA